MRGSLLRCSRKDKKRFIGKGWTVFLNGVDVTRRCQAFDEKEGRVLLLDLGTDGRPFYSHILGGVSRRWHRGRVRAFPPRGEKR